MADVKQKLLPQTTKNLIKQMGNGKYIVGNAKIIVSDGVVVTVVPAKE